MAKFSLLIFLIIIILSSINSITCSCPIDFSYVNTFPWDPSLCRNPIQNGCCQTLRSLFGMGLAIHLKQTSTFYLPNTTSSAACLSDFEAKISTKSIHQPFGQCLNDTNEFVLNPLSCANISDLNDWTARVGPSSPVDSYCNADLTGLTRCSSCVDAANGVNARLVAAYPNSTRCFYYTVLYAAGVVNDYGPEDVRTAVCILGMPLTSSVTRDRAGSGRLSQRTLKVIFASLGALTGVLLFFGAILVYRYWDKKRKQNAYHSEYVRSVRARVLPNLGAKWFRVGELDEATQGFSQRNLIGHGAFGVVYKGILADGTLVAVKQLVDLDSEGDEDFANEAEIISKIRHRNLNSLRGFCVTSDPIKGKRRYLVYDFMSNGSLDDHLFGKQSQIQSHLSWPQRKNIILDVAKGLAYLHYGIKPAIFHRDIKATNILLDSNMRAKVADFGLAKQSREGQSHMTTRVAGTYGYLAPEYALYGQLTEKSDVYSFGIIVLEIMSGRKVLDASNVSALLITDWAWDCVKGGKIEDIFDKGIKEEGPKGVMERFVHVGILCAHVMVALRPTISDALKMLEGDIDIPRLPDRPLPLSHESFRSSSRYGGSSLWSSEGSRGRSSIKIV